MVGSGSVHIADAAVELPGLSSFSCHSHRPSVRLKFACTINLLLSLLAAIIPWSLQTNLVVVSWAFSELVVSSCFMSIALFTFTFFFNSHTDILSTCTASTFLSFRCPSPCRSFVSYSLLLIVIWSCSLFSVLSRPS
jgi:hypothetical protein